MDSPNPDENGKQPSSSIPSTPPPAPSLPTTQSSLKRPGLVSSNSTQNISGGLDGFLRGAAMTFNQSSPKKPSQTNSLEDEAHSDSTEDEDTEDSSTDDDDDEDQEQDQESGIAKKLKSSDQESLKQVKQSSIRSFSSGAGDPLGSGSGSLSSGEKNNPLESISLTPMTSNQNDDDDRDERLGQRIDESGKESHLLKSKISDSKEDEAIKQSIKENSQTIDELKRKQNQAEKEKDWDGVRDKGLEAKKKEKKKRRALGRLIRRTRGEFLDVFGN